MQIYYLAGIGNWLLRVYKDSSYRWQILAADGRCISSKSIFYNANAAFNSGRQQLDVMNN